MRHVAEFLEFAVNTRGFTPSTARAYGAALSDFANTVGIEDPAAVTITDLDLYMTRKQLAGTATSTRRTRAHAIKAFFNYLVRVGVIGKSPAEDFRPPDEKIGAVPTFSEEEIQALIFFKHTPTPRGRRESLSFFEKRTKVQALCAMRDSALLGLCYVVGLRSGEVAGLPVSALAWDPKTDDCFISLYGKGAKEPRPAYVDKTIAAMLQAYLYARQQAGIVHPALFCPINPRTRLAKETEKGIANHRVCEILDARVSDAGIDPRGRHLTPHTFRYSRATHLFEEGMPTPEIQNFLRHKSIETTMRYIRLGSLRAIQRRAEAKLPWNRPKFVQKVKP